MNILGRVRSMFTGPRGRAVRFFASAQYSRLMADFNDPMASADQANRGALRILRDRARQLERDTPLATAFIQLAVDNIVGPDGFQLRATTGDAAINEQIKQKFLAWCDHQHCGVDGRQSFTDIERLVVRRWRGADGEALVRFVRGVGRFGLQLQVLDPDVIDERYNRIRQGNQNAIRQGVEVDELGRPVAYHMWTAHPSEWSGPRERVKVPAEDILHVYSMDRPGQTRGITAFAPVMKNLWHLAGMQHAVLIGQRVAASQMAFLIPGEGTDVIQDTANPTKSVNVEVAPGSFPQLPAGYTVAPWAPTMPNGYYEPFLRMEQQHVASGLGVTYASLTGDATAANYGSQRGMLIRERRMWLANQEELREAFHERVFAEWIRMASIAGEVKLRGADYRTVPTTWLMPTWEWIDPLKDTVAALQEVAAGLNSLTNVCAARGRDFETILRQRAEELRLAKELGVPLFVPTTLTIHAESDTTGTQGNGAQGGAAAGANGAGRADAIRLLRSGS